LELAPSLPGVAAASSGQIPLLLSMTYEVTLVILTIHKTNVNVFEKNPIEMG
jgi:hypothetical protein